jgi:hypothetical protein
LTGQWLPDPDGRHEYRWWDGQSWTDQVSNAAEAPTFGIPVPTQ